MEKSSQLSGECLVLQALAQPAKTADPSKVPPSSPRPTSSLAFPCTGLLDTRC